MELTKNHSKTSTLQQSQKGKSSFFSFGQPENTTPFFQPKLSINSPNDVYEREADAIAEQVVSH